MENIIDLIDKRLEWIEDIVKGYIKNYNDEKHYLLIKRFQSERYFLETLKEIIISKENKK